MKSAINPLMELFNSESQFPSSEIRAKLEQMQGKYSTDSVHSNWTVIKALRSDVWRQSTDYLQMEVPVLDDDSMFIGLTSRAKLIEGILG